LKRKLKAKVFEDENVKKKRVFKKDDPEVKDWILKFIELHSYSKLHVNTLR
jgi:hypothetical protein